MRIAKSNVTANEASCKKCGAKWFPLMSKPEHDLLEIVDPQGSDIIPSTVTSAVQMLKVNVLVNTLCQKYWGPDLEAVKLRLDANNSFARGNLQDAVDIYTKAVKLGKFTIILIRNKSACNPCHLKQEHIFSLFENYMFHQILKVLFSV